MQTYFGILTIGASPVQISSSLFPNQNGSVRVNKLYIQHAPGNTGNFKVGGNSQLAMANTSPGTTIAPMPAGQSNPDASTPPGGDWVVESYGEQNDIALNQYFFHGSHAGDLLMWEIHIKG